MKISEQLLRRFEPQEEWLAHDSQLHGVGHMTRVLILQELIAERLEQSGAAMNREALRYGAMAHDIGRLDDGTDPEHGERSAQWIRAHLADRMMPEALDIATYIVRWHVPPDNAAPDMTIELQVLKDADGLDRVRLRDLNTSYLRTSVANGLIDIAQRLFDYSLPASRDVQKETFADVLAAAKRLRLVAE